MAAEVAAYEVGFAGNHQNRYVSYVFEISGETVWSPALRIGQVYEGFVTTLSGTLDQPSGFSFNGADFVIIDSAVFAAFVQRLLHETAGHPLLTDQARPVLGPSVVMLDRVGASPTPETPEQAQLLDELRTVAASMPT